MIYNFNDMNIRDSAHWFSGCYAYHVKQNKPICIADIVTDRNGRYCYQCTDLLGKDSLIPVTDVDVYVPALGFIEYPVSTRPSGNIADRIKAVYMYFDGRVSYKRGLSLERLHTIQFRVTNEAWEGNKLSYGVNRQRLSRNDSGFSAAIDAIFHPTYRTIEDALDICGARRECALSPNFALYDIRDENFMDKTLFRNDKIKNGYVLMYKGRPIAPFTQDQVVHLPEKLSFLENRIIEEIKNVQVARLQ